MLACAGAEVSVVSVGAGTQAASDNQSRPGLRLLSSQLWSSYIVIVISSSDSEDMSHDHQTSDEATQ